MSAAQHTPGTWETDGRSIDAAGTHIAYVDTCDTNAGLAAGEGEANARRIVKCVNEYDALLAAVQRAIYIREKLSGNAAAQAWDKLSRGMYAAIAKATGSAS